MHRTSNDMKLTSTLTNSSITFEVPEELRNDIHWVLPKHDGGLDYVLVTNGDGVLSFIDVTTLIDTSFGIGTEVVDGTPGSIPYINSNRLFEQSSSLRWDDEAQCLSIRTTDTYYDCGIAVLDGNIGVGGDEGYGIRFFGTTVDNDHTILIKALGINQTFEYVLPSEPPRNDQMFLACDKTGQMEWVDSKHEELHLKHFIVDDGVALVGENARIIHKTSTQAEVNTTYYWPDDRPDNIDYVLTTNGAGTLSWADPSMMMDITINGSEVVGSKAGLLLFTNENSEITQTPNLFWDETHQRLGIGTDTPTSTLDINGSVSVTNDLHVKSKLKIEDDSFFISFTAPKLEKNIRYTLPDNYGRKNSVLMTNGFGGMFWGSPSSQTEYYTKAFTNDDLDDGVLNVVHNLRMKYCLVQVYDHNDVLVSPNMVKLIDDTSLMIVLKSFGEISGVWHVVVR